MTFKTLSRATAAFAISPSRTTATRGGMAMASGRVTNWAQSLYVGLNTPVSTPTFGRGAFTPIIRGRGAVALSSSGRGIMRLDDPGYTGVRRNGLATPRRSGRSSSASVRIVDLAELESRLRQEMNEKVGAFEEQLMKKKAARLLQTANGLKRMQ